MMCLLPFTFRRGGLIGAVLIALAAAAEALEPRTWISLDGRTLDAELIKTEGDIVELKDKEGRTLKVPKSSLSFGDLDYIAEYAPEEKAGSLAAKPAAAEKMPNPAKEMKFNNKLLKKVAGQMKLGDLTLNVCETPRLKILYSKGVDPTDTAELGERLWHATAFFHGSFAGKFKDRRMAIIMAEGEKDFKMIGSWYAEILNAAGQTEAAGRVTAEWDKSSGMSLALPADFAAANGLLPEATLLRIKTRGQQIPGIGARGVWDSFRTFILSRDLLGIQAGGLAGFAREGQFAIFTGYCYHMEIGLTGASATGLFQKKTGNAGPSYDAGKNWPAELKRRLRKGDVNLNLTVLWASSLNDAKADDFVMAYSFSRFLQSTPARLTAYGKLMERISTSQQVPDPDSVAKIYGIADAASLEKEWREYVESGDFR